MIKCLVILGYGARDSVVNVIFSRVQPGKNAFGRNANMGTTTEKAGTRKTVFFNLRFTNFVL